MYATVNFRMQIVENRGLIIEVVDDTGAVRERHIDDTYAGQSTAPWDQSSRVFSRTPNPQSLGGEHINKLTRNRAINRLTR